MKKTILLSSLIEEAKNLKSEDGENSEYDRALVELVGYSMGYSSEDFNKVRKLLEIKNINS